MVTVSTIRPILTWRSKTQIAFACATTLAQRYFVVNIFSCTVDTFLVVLIPCTGTGVTSGLFAPFFLLFVFLFVRTRFVYVWHYFLPQCVQSVTQQ